MVMRTLLLGGVGSSLPASGNWPFFSEATALIAAEAAVIYSSLCENKDMHLQINANEMLRLRKARKFQKLGLLQHH